MSSRSEERPSVSVIVPAYRAENSLEECLASVGNQTFGDFECIVVDDASPDLGALIATRFGQRDSRFRVIAHESNKGVSGARNSGLHSASGRYVLFLDSDDILLPDALESQYGLACQYNVDAVWTTDEFWYGAQRTHRNYCNIFHLFPNIPMDTSGPQREVSLRAYRFNTPNGRLLLRHAVLSLSSITFDETLVCGEDIDFVSRALRACKSAAVAPLVTLLYRKGHDSLSNARSLERWRSFGQFQRKISERNSDWPDFRIFFALCLLGHTVESIATLRRHLARHDALEIVSDIAQAYHGVDATIFGDTPSHPGDTPWEWDACFQPVFEALIRQDPITSIHCVDKLALTLFREELLDATQLRLAGDDEAADKLVAVTYAKQPWHPELAFEYARILERDKSKRAEAIELFSYAYLRSVRLFEPAAALAWAIAGNGWSHQGSIDVIKHGLRQAPQSPTLFDLLARFHERAGENENRLSALRQACTYAPKDLARRERLIEGLLDCSKRDPALEEIDGFAEWAGDGWRERMLSLVDSKSGALGSAKKRIDRLVQQTGECDMRALVLQGDILLDLEDYAGALHPLGLAAYHEQNNANQRIKLATAEWKSGHSDKALGILEEIIEYPQRKIDELFAELIDNLDSSSVAAFLRSRRVLLARTPALVSRIWKRVRTSPHANELAPAVGELLHFVAAQNAESLFVQLMQLEFLLWKKDLTPALEKARLLCSAFPQDARTHMMLGRCLAGSQSFAEAAEAGSAACRLDPGNDLFVQQTERWKLRSIGRARLDKPKAAAE